ncbi:MAG: DNA-3-methyladenine glycosylase [Cellulomonas sp.]
MTGARPSPGWFEREVTVVARDLLGAELTTFTPEGTVTIRITEVEAYGGAIDPGSHAFRGRTRRNAVMFEEPGRLYVYRHLGLHHCMNIVVGPTGTAAAVLLRAGEVVDGKALALGRRTASGAVRADVDLARGPARLAVALGVDLGWYGRSVLDDDALVLRVRGAQGDAGAGSGPTPADDAPAPAPDQAPVVASGPRVGVSGDGGDPQLFPWRFWLAGDRTVSAYRPAAPRRATFRVTAASRHNGATPVLKEKP